jgi:hypothetical protein
MVSALNRANGLYAGTLNFFMYFMYLSFSGNYAFCCITRNILLWFLIASQNPLFRRGLWRRCKQRLLTKALYFTDESLVMTNSAPVNTQNEFD